MNSLTPRDEQSLAKHLFPYQWDWLADPSRFKNGIWARQADKDKRLPSAANLPTPLRRGHAAARPTVSCLILNGISSHPPLPPSLTPLIQPIILKPMTVPNAQPLTSLDEWEDDLKVRYPEPGKPAFQATDPDKKKEQFRDYAKNARPSVREFYRLNHTFQSHEFVKAKKADFLQRNRRQMTVWEAAEYLNNLVDDSDPDTDMSQLEHLLQTAEQIRKDGQPRWFILTGFIHDLGKILCLYGEPQWAVVGDTFPVGCAFSDKIVFPEFFDANPDRKNPELSTKLGVYEEGCGLDNVDLSWGHDEYIYHVVKDRMPDEALYMLRYHSFYPAHREGEYDYLMNDKDRKLFDSVRAFNPYDLYTKNHEKPNVEKLKPFYMDLINEYLPGKLNW